MVWKDQAMRLWYNLRLLDFFLIIMGLSMSIGYAEDALSLEKATECSKIGDRVQRLYCFDTLFNSPVSTSSAEKISEKPIEQPDGPLKSLASLLERQRTADDTNWVLRMRPWHETTLLTIDDFNRILTNTANRHSVNEKESEQSLSPQTVDVFLTTREAKIPDNINFLKEAIMMLSCENDITTLAVLLPKPITTLQANITLSSGNGSIFKLHWRDVENGGVIIAGRGLESIDTIKTIANYPRVQLQVNYPDDGPRVFIFDMNDLGNKLKPLRLACHW